MKNQSAGYTQYSTSYSYSYRDRRCKADWAGVGIGEAFKSNLDYYVRMPARRLFYKTVKTMQISAAKLAGVSVAPGFKPVVKPQISPFYTRYPATLSAYAAIGLTSYLEYKNHAGNTILFTHLNHYLENPAQHDRVQTDPTTYQRIARIVTEHVQTRLLLEDISRSPHMVSVEIYRLFSASQQTLKFRSLPEIIRSVILYGDIMPDWERMNVHPMSCDILLAIEAASSEFFMRLPQAKDRELIDLGMRWVKSVCRCLVKYLPEPKKPEVQPPPETVPQFLSNRRGRPQDYRFSNETAEPPDTDKIPPLDEPQPPSLFDPAGMGDPRLTPPELMPDPFDILGPTPIGQDTGSPPPVSKPMQDALRMLMNLLNNAGGQVNDWEDMRSDRVEKALRDRAFSEGPIEGNPSDGHEVSVHMSGGDVAEGEIFDRPVELSDDINGYDALRQKALPIVNKLKKALYPNIEHSMEAIRHHCSGSLDPSKLALAGISDAVFKQYHLQEQADPRGRPVVLIACDGSASLSNDQMNMTKVLAASWLESTARSGVTVMAALYHSGAIRRGLTGPLVQWVSHPTKSPATSHSDAVRALVTLPNCGTGAQSDAVSLAFVLEEAKRVARGKMIYMILISDCEWNRCLQTDKNGLEEVQSFFEAACEDSGDKLHTTLVALGVRKTTGFENILDKVVSVTPANLKNPAAVAEQVGVYVAKCMRERQKLVRKQ